MTVYDGGCLPELNRTNIIDAQAYRFGGNALNLACLLNSLGRRVAFIAACGSCEFSQFTALLQSRSLEHASIQVVHNRTDALIIFRDAGATRSFYICNQLSRQATESLASKAQGFDWIIFSGTRHIELQRTLLISLRSTGQAKVVFAPSYSIYSFEPDDLEQWLSTCNLIVLNAQEEAYVQSLGFGRLLDDPAKISVTTRGARGADIRETKDVYKIPSYSNFEGDVIGAGDAFLAGYLDRHIDGESGITAGQFGALAADELIKSKELLPFLDVARLTERIKSAQFVNSPQAELKGRM